MSNEGWSQESSHANISLEFSILRNQYIVGVKFLSHLYLSELTNKLIQLYI